MAKLCKMHIDSRMHLDYIINILKDLKLMGFNFKNIIFNDTLINVFSSGTALEYVKYLQCNELKSCEQLRLKVIHEYFMLIGSM